jgi:hypothetical protein
MDKEKVKETLNEVGSMLNDLWNFLVKWFWIIIAYIKNFDYAGALDIFRENMKIFLNSRSIYFISIFLPIILTLVVAISVNQEHKLEYDMGYSYNPNATSKDMPLESFITGLNSLELKNYPNDQACLDDVRTGTSASCIILSEDFFTDTNTTDILTFNIGENYQANSVKYLSAINSSLVSVVSSKSLADHISLKKVQIRDRKIAVLVIQILMFFLMFLTMTFASVIIFYKKPKLSELYSNRQLYKYLILDCFFSTFLFFLVVSFVLFLILSLAFNISLFLVFKSLLIMIFALSMLTFVGLLTGLLTTIEDINLFATVSIASIMIFLSELILPSYTGILSYLINVNPYHITIKLLKNTVLFGKSIGGYSFEFMILLICVAVLATLFILVYYLFGENDTSLRKIIKDKHEYHPHPDDFDKPRSPSLRTEDMSMHQYQHLEELRKIRAKQTAQSKPTYQSIVKVKLDKPKSESRTDRTDSRDLREGRATLGSLRQHNDDRDDRRETSEKEERGDEYLEELYEKEYKDEDQKKGITVSRRNDDNEMQEIGKPSGTSGRALSSKKQAKKGREVEDQEDTDNLIASIDLENKVLQLKHKGLKDSEIISKLKGRYKESEIRDVLSNI